MEENYDFEGLATASLIPETDPNPLPRGKNIDMRKILGEWVDEAAPLFDRDVEESSEDDD